MSYELRRQVVELLDALDYELACRNSFLDYHIKGLDYLCLLRTDRVTVKLYRSDPMRVRVPGTGSQYYHAAPHNHAYAFEQTVLSGRVDHHVFKRRGWLWDATVAPVDSVKWREYLWRHEGKMMVPMETTWLSVKTDALRQNARYSLLPEQIHSLTFPTDRPTVLFTVQRHDVMFGGTGLYIPNGQPLPSIEGCYRKPSSDELRNLGKRIRGQIL